MVPPDVAAAMVDELMVEREALLARRVAGREIGRDDDPPVEQAERERPLHRRALDQRQAAMGAEAARASG